MKAQTKALIASVVVIALALSAVSGITYSWWSDSESTDITVNTGYVKVDTSNFSIKKGSTTYDTGSGSSIPENIGIMYTDTESDAGWFSDSNRLVVTGDPAETIVISYTATFTWTVAAKFTMGYGSTSEALKTNTSMIIVADGTLSAEPNEWVTPSDSNSNAGYSVTVTINGLPAGLTDAELQINNYITQAKNPISIWDGSSTAVTPTTEGSTTVYEIRTASELAWVADQVNARTNCFNGNTVKLMNDIDLSGINWTPIGYNGGMYGGFSGIFDGQNNTIYGLNIETPINQDKIYASGLFGYVSLGTADACIKNLTLDGATVKGQHWVGGIAGTIDHGSINACTVKNSVITNSYEDDERDGDKTGGIVGFVNLNASVSQCSVENISLTGVRDIGCISGYVHSGNSFKNNIVSGENSISIDRTSGYRADKSMNYDEIVVVGSDPWDSTNKVTGTVTISAKVNDSTSFNAALSEGISTVYVAPISASGKYIFKNQSTITLETINITLLGDVTFTADSGTLRANAFGGSDTDAVTFDGQSLYTLTFYHPDSDANHVATNGAKLVLKNLKLSNSGYNDGPWNRHDIVFDCEVELSNVQSDKAIALGENAVFNNVTIADAGDVYALWIKADVQNVVLDYLTIKNPNGRAIAIKDQYVQKDDRISVNLTIKNSNIESQRKAAILVTSTAGATISASNVNISNVTADTEHLVWIDNRGYEDDAETIPCSSGPVIVTGGSVIVEP